MIGMMESVFEVTELDPLPFVNPRDNRNESKGNSERTGSSTSPIGATAALPSPARTHRPALPDPVSEPEWQKSSPREGNCPVLVCPFGGDNRLAPERLSRLLQTAQSRGQLVDVSMSGAALHLTHEFAPGTRVALRISNRTYGKHVDAAATVLRCRQDGDIGWNVVCRFDKNLTFEQIHVIGRNLFASTIV